MSSEENKNEGSAEDSTAGATGESDEKSSSDDLPSFLQGLLARLGISKPGDTEQEPEHEQVLEEVTFEGIAKYIQTEKCTKYGNN
ncbi:Hypothetical predicted protein [Paramuricea clavata]|uniref:Uncharacterized protein n=1 Tax=Paramuricea clavata TaxID=317549 RepID=A0A6S7FZB8_PARCT|nr:Hypothetical predicted protein [Paramuricea clavata]